jgi:hypothetical protein
MKKILLLLMLVGCMSTPNGTIVGKFTTNRPNICRFQYQTNKLGDTKVFEDSCHVYNVGDIIKFQKR